MDNDRVFDEFYEWVADKVNCEYIFDGNKVTFYAAGEKICKFYGKRKMVVHRPNGTVRIYGDWTIMSFYKIVDVIKYR